MRTGTILEFSLAVLSVSIVGLVVAIVIEKRRRDRRDVERSRRVIRVRPQVLSLLEQPISAGEHMTGGLLRPLHLRPRDNSVAVGLIVSLLPKLRGSDRDALVAALVERGLIDSALRSIRRRRRVRRLDAVELLGAAGLLETAAPLGLLLAHRDPETRMAAARSLGRIGHPPFSKELIASLTGSRSIPVNTVSMALLRIGAPSTPALIDALQDPSALVRAVSADVLGALGALGAAGPLESLLHDPVAAVRVAAVRSLGRLAVPGTAQTVARLLADELALDAARRDTEFAVWCIVALGQLGDRRAIPILTSALASRHRLAFASATALAAMGPRRTPSSIRRRAGGSGFDHSIAQMLAREDPVAPESIEIMP